MTFHIQPMVLGQAEETLTLLWCGVGFTPFEELAVFFDGYYPETCTP